MNNIRALVVTLWVLFPAIVHGAGTAALLVIPSKTTPAVGEEVTVTVAVSSTAEAMNAVSGSILFPPGISIGTISTQGSIINFWTEAPHVFGNKISFEGIALNPGYQGSKGKLFSVTAVSKKSGNTLIAFSDGAVLANDGKGTNIVGTLGTSTLSFKNWETAPLAQVSEPEVRGPQQSTKVALLPVITSYSSSIDTVDSVHIIGTGAPGALTKIVFKDASFRSLGERFMALVQAKKQQLAAAVVQNDSSTGIFQYRSPANLVAGAYNATPYLVDDNTEKEGTSVQVFVHDSKIVRALVVLVNVLALLVPIVGLIVLIYFIPWYSRRRMHLLKEQLALEEEKLKLSEHELVHKEKVIDG